MKPMYSKLVDISPSFTETIDGYLDLCVFNLFIFFKNLHDIEVARADNQTSSEWLKKHGLEAESLTLNELLKNGNRYMLKPQNNYCTSPGDFYLYFTWGRVFLCIVFNFEFF